MSISLSQPSFGNTLKLRSLQGLFLSPDIFAAVLILFLPPVCGGLLDVWSSQNAIKDVFHLLTQFSFQTEAFCSCSNIKLQHINPADKSIWLEHIAEHAAADRECCMHFADKTYATRATQESHKLAVTHVTEIMTIVLVSSIKFQ